MAATTTGSSLATSPSISSALSSSQLTMRSSPYSSCTRSPSRRSLLTSPRRTSPSCPRSSSVAAAATLSSAAVAVLLLAAVVAGQQSPQFLPGGDMTDFSVGEDTPVGTVVYTLKGSDPLDRPLSYSASGDQLSVDPVTGEVTLVLPLDREEMGSINTIVTVTAESPGGGNPVIVAVRRQIPVEDVNDNAPRFVGEPYTFQVAESSPPGATLYSEVRVQDLDAGPNARVEVTCDQQKTPESCSMFEVRSAKTGEGEVLAIISLGTSLDYERTTHYDIALTAKDHGPDGGLSSQSSVSVEVQDVQDEAPVFLNSPYSATVREALQNSRKLLQGTRVLHIRVKDADLGHPNPLRLSLEGDSKGYFTLQEIVQDGDGVTNAVLTTSDRLLDREDPAIMSNGGLYSFSVRAEEVGGGGGAGASTTAPVTIVVTDADDLLPVFSSAMVEVAVSEDLANGTPLSGLDLVVSDGDLGDHAKFALSLDPVSPAGSAGLFTVFPKMVVGRSPVILKVADSSRIDFEQQDASQFVVRVIASQDGTPVASALVNISVTDANDNPPLFESPSYRSSVSESAKPGASITSITATDADSGTYADISYSLKGFGSEKFRVDPSTGEIFLSTCGGLDHCLDYERQASYSLTYLATDGGGKLTSVNLFLDVLDENDNSPLFSQLVYRRTVDEAATDFVPPLIVEAMDADGEQQGGGAVVYSIHDGNTEDGVFVIDPVTGEVTVTRPLTYLDTATSSYTLTVRARDAGEPPRYSDVRLIIKVGRQTNKSPRFVKKDYSTAISETAQPGFLVETLEAMDPDGDPSVGDIASYRLGTGAGDTFVIDASSGIVTLAAMAKLDRDDSPQYKIQVLAVDRDKEAPQTATVTLTVDITDVNNRPPKFVQASYTEHISERLPLESEVVRVSATDPDLDAELLYHLSDRVVARDRTGVSLSPDSSYHYRDAFSINSSSGAVSVSGPLDHNEAAVMILTVTATDVNASAVMPQQHDTAEITIYIQAFSDKNPIFGPPWTPSHPHLEVQLKEEEPLDKPVFAVTAKDPVSGQPVRRYEKLAGSDPDGVFSVAPITGQVSLNRRMDYEASPTKTASLRVLAVAGDRSSEATVTVTLLDINDNSPQYTEQEYHGRISEDSRWPSPVVQVSAMDADTGAFGSVRYTIGGEAAMLFVINDTTGEISVARGAVLDREQQNVLTLLVTATDTPGGGLTSRRTAVKVVIELTDVNDEAPVWSEGSYTAVVAENAVTGSPVTHVLATDPDAGLNGLVRYFLPENQVPLDGLFTLDPESGILSVSAPLRGKGRGESYELTVRAIDQGSPQQFSEAILKLYIGDVSSNDGVPKFVSPSPNQVATVLENSKAGTAVFQVKAEDPDDPNSPNGKLLYSFLDSTANNGLFLIDSHSGVISTQAPLDRERRPQYTVVVVAQDLGRPPQQTSRVLTINVTDADDNDPVFLKLSQGDTEFELEEEAATGTVVGIVSATDRDQGDNAMIDYAITYGNDEGLLELERTENNTARLSVRRRIDREEISSLRITIACGKLGSRLPSRLQYRDGDPSLLQVLVVIKDLDDNRPRFESDLVQAGVRVDAPLQTEVVTVTATDPDPTAPSIRYTLHNVSFEHTSSGYPRLPAGEVEAGGVFLLEEQTGILLTHAPLTRYTHGTFTITVAATSEPDQEPVYARVKVVVVRDSDLLRFVFSVPPGEVRPKLTSFKQEVQESLPVVAHLAVYDTAYYRDGNGVTDYSKTGSCFQLEERSRQDAKVLLKDVENERLKEVYDKFDVTDVERCVEPRVYTASTADWVEVWVLVLAGLVGVGAAVAACTVCCLYSRYKRNIRKQQPHFRLLDSPLPGHQLTATGPGSLIMLPTGPMHLQPGGPGPMHHHHHHPSSVPPSEAGRAYEWQERGMPMDTVSFSSVAR